MRHGQAQIGVIAIVAATTTFFMGWDSWLSVRSIEQGENMAVVANTLDQILEDVSEIKVITRLTAPSLGVNPDVAKIATSTE